MAGRKRGGKTPSAPRSSIHPNLGPSGPVTGVKRRRAPTTTASSGPSLPSSEEQLPPADTSEVAGRRPPKARLQTAKAPEESRNPQPDPLPIRPYATRASNKAHPAAAFGLEKRTQVEISAAAEAKRQLRNDAAQAKQAKQAKQAEQKQREQAGIRTLAALEDARSREDALEEWRLAGGVDDGYPDDAEMAFDNIEELEVDQEFNDGQSALDFPSGSLSAASLDGIEADESDDDEKLAADSYERDDGMTMLSGEESVDEVIKAPRKGKSAPKISAKEKKQLHVDQIHRAIAGARTTTGAINAPPAAKARSASRGRAQASEDKVKTVSGLNKDWSARVKGRHSNPRGAGSASPVPSAASSSHVAAHRHAIRKQDSVENIGSFDDGDVLASREDIGGQARGRRPQMVGVVAPSQTSKAPAASSSRAKTSAPKSSGDPPKSSALMNLPEYLQDDFGARIVPTLVAFYGAQDYPWDLDQKQGLFLLILRDVHHHLYPERHYEVQKSDLLYIKARQSMYDWRRKFYRVALKAAEDAVRVLPDAGRVKAFVRESLKDNGAAFWKEPHPTNAQGALQSIYIMKTFASHIEAIEGTVFDYGLPKGALSLAIAAVHRAFNAYSTGTRSSSGVDREFSELQAGDLTKQYRERSVEDFVEKPHRFKRYIDMTSKIVSDDLAARRGVNAQGKRPQAAVICDPSSPIPSGEE